VIRTVRPTRPMTVNMLATLPLFETNLDEGGFDIGFR
jgi:hypothetical protein